MQFAGYTNIVFSYVESTLYDLLQMMIPLLLCRQQRGPRKDMWKAEPPVKRLCLRSSVDASARLPKHNNGPRCRRVVNSGIHAPHPLDLRGVIIKPPKPRTILNFKHLKHLGPCRQRALSSLESKTMDLNSTIPLAIAAAFLAEVIMYLSSSCIIGQM